MAPETPLPAISADALQQIPTFPQLLPQQPSYFDIAKAERSTFALEVAAPGLYRTEISGLLQTQGTIRTRTVISLDRQASNGTGRNSFCSNISGMPKNLYTRLGFRPALIETQFLRAP